MRIEFQFESMFSNRQNDACALETRPSFQFSASVPFHIGALARDTTVAKENGRPDGGVHNAMPSRSNPAGIYL